MLSLGLLFVNTYVFAQTGISVENLYRGGQEAFNSKMKKELRYPAPAVQNGRTGMALVSFSIDPKGGLTGVNIVNSVDPTIDEEVKRALLTTSANWTAGRANTRQEYILPVLFAANEASLKNIKVPATVLKPIVVTQQALPVIEGPDFPQELSLALRQGNHFMANYRSDLALLMLNELVRKNPFNKEIRETRAYVYSQMNQPDKARQERAFVDQYLVSETVEE